MNDRDGRWWYVAIVAGMGVLALAVVAGPDTLSQGAAGLLGLAILGVCLLALLLTLAAVWPGFVGRAETNLQTSPVKSLLVGLVNYLFLGAIALVLMNLGPLAAVGLLVAGVLLLGTMLGLPAVAGLVGARLSAMREQAATRWGELALGGAALYLAALLPAVGWFLFLPALLLWSFGAAALAVAGRRAASPIAAGGSAGEAG